MSENQLNDDEKSDSNDVLFTGVIIVLIIGYLILVAISYKYKDENTIALVFFWFNAMIFIIGGGGTGIMLYN